MAKIIANRNKVLHLARWYPNRYDPMPGLFIQRHAEAANNCCDSGVVYTHQVDDLSGIKSIYDIDYKLVNGVPTAKVYYLSSNIKLFPFNKLINIFRFFKANNIGIQRIKKQLGGFDIVHVHVLTRLGLIAYYYSLFKGKPYVVTEHWSRYLQLTGAFNGTIRKVITRLVVRNASSVTAVTDNLANAMQSHKLLNSNYIILPNVVDEVFMGKVNIVKDDKKTVFVHVSCFEDKSKNVSGLLRVIRKLSESRNDFIFKLIGDGMDMELLVSYASELGLTNNQVVFTGLLEGKELVKEMANSDMLVIFSNYENFPVVINESLSLGVPVIATRVGGIPERVNKENGILIDSGNEDQLLSGFINQLDKKINFNSDKIKKKAKEEFSSEIVGDILCKLYSKALNP